MLKNIFGQYMENHRSQFFKPCSCAFDALETAIRSHLPACDSVEWVEDAIMAYGYEAEKAGFYMGFAKGAAFMGEVTTLSNELLI